MKADVGDVAETVERSIETEQDRLERWWESFDDFYARERGDLVALAFALCGSTGLAEDLVQDAFVSAIDRWDRIANPSAWMRGVIANKSVSLFRRRATEARYFLLGHAPELAAGPELLCEVNELWAEVRRLPRRQAQVVALRYVDGAAVTEIAEVLGVSENTVKTHLRRAKQSLAHYREDHS